MTSALGHPAPIGVRHALAQRFGADIVPMDLQDSGDELRARFVATLQLLIAWVLEHPHIPVPWSSGLSIEVPDVATLEKLGAELGVKPYPADAPEQVTLFDPFDDREFYCPITLRAAKPDRPL